MNERDLAGVAAIAQSIGRQMGIATDEMEAITFRFKGGSGPLRPEGIDALSDSEESGARILVDVVGTPPEPQAQARLVLSSRVGKEVCEVLGLDPRQAVGLVLEFDVKKPVLATIRRLVTEEEVAGLIAGPFATLSGGGASEMVAGKVKEVVESVSLPR